MWLLRLEPGQADRGQVELKLSVTAASDQPADQQVLNSDVVLETRVLVSRRLEDKNESLGLGLGS